MLKVSRCSWVG